MTRELDVRAEAPARRHQLIFDVPAHGVDGKVIRATS
jgi:hypothetical protein